MLESKADTQRHTLHGGYGLVFLGALHTMALLAGGGSYLLAMIGNGWWQTASLGVSDKMHIAVFWSLEFGLMVMLMGWALVRVGRGHPPGSRSWWTALALVALLGALAAPVGGFWLVVAFSVWMIARGKPSATA